MRFPLPTGDIMKIVFYSIGWSVVLMGLVGMCVAYAHLVTRVEEKYGKAAAIGMLWLFAFALVLTVIIIDPRGTP